MMGEKKKANENNSKDIDSSSDVEGGIASHLGFKKIVNALLF